MLQESLEQQVGQLQELLERRLEETAVSIASAEERWLQGLGREQVERETRIDGLQAEVVEFKVRWDSLQDDMQVQRNEVSAMIQKVSELCSSVALAQQQELQAVRDEHQQLRCLLHDRKHIEKTGAPASEPKDLEPVTGETKANSAWKDDAGATLRELEQQVEDSREKLQDVSTTVIAMQAGMRAQQEWQDEAKLELDEVSMTQRAIKMQLQDMSSGIRPDMQSINIETEEVFPLSAALSSSWLDVVSANAEGTEQSPSFPPTPDTNQSQIPPLNVLENAAHCPAGAIREAVDLPLRSRVTELAVCVEQRLDDLEVAVPNLQEAMFQSTSNLERLIAQLWSELGQELAISGAQRNAKLHGHHTADTSPMYSSSRSGGVQRGRVLSPRYSEARSKSS